MTKFWPMRCEQKHREALAFSLAGGDGPFPFSSSCGLNKVINAGAFGAILSHQVTLRPEMAEAGDLSSGTILIQDFLSPDDLKKNFFLNQLH